MWRVWADPRRSHWFLLITILFGNLNANDTFNCKTGWMRFDLLGGNYFHALSRTDLSQKGGQQLLCKSFFSFAVFLFTFLTREERNKTWMQQNDFGFCSLTNSERKKKSTFVFFFLIFWRTQWTLRLHTWPRQQTFIQNFTRGHQFTYIVIQDTPMVQVSFIDKYCMFHILYRETKHLVFTHKQQQWMI